MSEEGLAECLAMLEEGIDAREAKERAEEKERRERLRIKLEDDEQKEKNGRTDNIERYLNFCEH